MTGTLKSWADAKEWCQKHHIYSTLTMRFLSEDAMANAYYRDPSQFVKKFMPHNVCNNVFWDSILRNYDEWYSGTLPSYRVAVTTRQKDICRLRIPATLEQEIIAIELIKKKYPYICGYRKTREYIIFCTNTADYTLVKEED